MRFTKPKLSPWQLYHIMQYLLNEDFPQIVFPYKGIGVEPSINSYKSAQNKLNEVLKTKTMLVS